MFKVLLIYPRFPIYEKCDVSVPLGLLHLGSYLKAHGIHSTIIDTTIEDNYYEIIEENMKDAILVGVSAMTVQIPHALDIISFVKRARPSMPVVVGGVHATLFPDQLTANENVDYCVIGEGEETLLEITEHVTSEGEHNELSNGICYKQNGSIVVENCYRRINFTTFPKIDYSLINPKVIQAYLDSPKEYFPLLTSRGCPHQCTFCLNTVFNSRRRFQALSPLRTVEEIEQVLSFGDTKKHRIWFWDENFFVNKKRVKEIMAILEERDLRFEWLGHLRVDYFREGFVDTPFLRQLKERGLSRVSLGLESGSDKILKHIKKNITQKDILRCAQYCKEVGIRPSFSLMIGIPEEMSEDMRLTVSLMRGLSKILDSWSMVGPQLYRPYPGSLLYHECIESGWKEPRTTEEWLELIKKQTRKLDAKDMPWIKDKKLANLIHFYTSFIPFPYKQIASTFKEYCNMTNRGTVFFIVGLLGALVLSSVGKMRYYLRFYSFFVEKTIFDKMRRKYMSG